VVFAQCARGDEFAHRDFHRQYDATARSLGRLGTYGDGRFVDCPHCRDGLKPNIVRIGENGRKAHAEQGYSMDDGAQASSVTVMDPTKVPGGSRA
jgi:hypothetical protein